MESTTHIVFIRMVSDVNNQGRGFEMKFSASNMRIYQNLSKQNKNQILFIRFWQKNNLQIVNVKLTIYVELLVTQI